MLVAVGGAIYISFQMIGFGTNSWIAAVLLLLIGVQPGLCACAEGVSLAASPIAVSAPHSNHCNEVETATDDAPPCTHCAVDQPCLKPVDADFIAGPVAEPVKLVVIENTARGDMLEAGFRDDTEPIFLSTGPPSPSPVILKVRLLN